MSWEKQSQQGEILLDLIHCQLAPSSDSDVGEDGTQLGKQT